MLPPILLCTREIVYTFESKVNVATKQKSFPPNEAQSIEICRRGMATFARPLSFILVLTFVTNLIISAKSETTCCDKVYLFSSGHLVDYNPVLLGIYAQAGVHNNRPYYEKPVSIPVEGQNYHMDFYLVYVEKPLMGPIGWRVSEDLDGNVTWISTNGSFSDFDSCPIGIEEGFGSWLDKTFSIECHRDEIVDTCDDCEEFSVTSTGSVAATFQLNLGKYALQHEGHNGHPYFKMQETVTFSGTETNFTSYLYFRKFGKKIFWDAKT